MSQKSKINTKTSIALPPLRSLDEFLLGSARFQLPNFNDVERWGNRVNQNLIYFQTNYFAMAFLILMIFLFIYPKNTVIGVFVIALMMYLIINFGYKLRILTEHLQNPRLPIAERFAFSIGICFIVLFSAYILWDYLIYGLLIILLPFCVAFVHSSLCLRNIRNKLANTIDGRLRYTPMGVFFDAMCIHIDGYFQQN